MDNIDFLLIFEDEDLLVVNKPPWQLSVPGKKPEMISAYDYACDYLKSAAFIVHRLDCATSGIMIFAKNAQAQRVLHASFRRRLVSKIYQAILCHKPNQEFGSVDLPLITDWPQRPKQMIDLVHGKEAFTYWSLAHRPFRNDVQVALSQHVDSAFTGVYLRPHTGRTHQLRLHTQALNAPILGDRLYAEPEFHSQPHGDAPFERLYLHAESIYLQHPTQLKSISFSAQDRFSFFEAAPHQHLKCQWGL